GRGVGRGWPGGGVRRTRTRHCRRPRGRRRRRYSCRAAARRTRATDGSPRGSGCRTAPWRQSRGVAATRAHSAEVCARLTRARREPGSGAERAQLLLAHLVGGIERLRLAEVGDRVGLATERFIGEAAIVIGLDIFLIIADCLAEIGDCPRMVALCDVCRAARVEAQ